jgi:hypothetical protein
LIGLAVGAGLGLVAVLLAILGFAVGVAWPTGGWRTIFKQ